MFIDKFPTDSIWQTLHGSEKNCKSPTAYMNMYDRPHPMIDGAVGQ